MEFAVKISELKSFYKSGERAWNRATVAFKEHYAFGKGARDRNF